MGWNGITLNGKNPKNIIKDEIERDKRFEVKYLSKKGKVIYTAIKNKDTEIMVDYKNREIITLEKLLPDWWGMYRYEKDE